MDRTVKGTIAVIVSIVVLFFAVFGSYLPMRKAEIYIATLQGFSTQPPQSLQDLEQRLSVGLDYYAPIGQEELVRNTANSVLGLVQRGVGATTTAQLMDYLNGYYAPILDRGKGMSFGQDLYLMGAVNEIAFAQTGDPTYLQAAQKWYEEGHAMGPNRPQSLYGLFDTYRAEGNVSSTVMIAQQIMGNWPNDTNVPGALASFLSSIKSPTKK